MQVTKHVAIKCRISSDDQQRGEGVAAQEAWGRDYSARMWPDIPIEVYVDNDISATDRETERPGFQRLVANVQAGKVAHIVTVERSRVVRDAAEWFDFVDDILIPAGIEELHTKRRGIMRVDDLGADVDAVLGRREVRIIKQRVLDKHEWLAAEGRPSGGLQLGYRSDRDEEGRPTLAIEPMEADAIRWACDALLAGWSLASIGREWDKRGIERLRKVRPKGAPKDVPLRKSTKPWAESTAVIARLLAKPTIAGLRIHDGQRVRATWEPIIDEAKWRHMCAALDARKKVTGKDGRQHPVTHSKRPARRYLLTGGIARCGLCGAPLVGQQRRWKSWKGPLLPYYSCHPSRGGCQKIGITGEPFEEEVARQFLVELDRPAFRSALEATDDNAQRREEILDELRDIDLRHAELGRLWAAKKIDPAGWVAAGQDLDVEKARLNAELSHLSAAVPAVDVDSVKDDWPHATLDEKRWLLSYFLEEVTVAPAVPGRRFDPGRIKLHWRRR